MVGEFIGLFFGVVGNLLLRFAPLLLAFEPVRLRAFYLFLLSTPVCLFLFFQLPSNSQEVGNK